LRSAIAVPNMTAALTDDQAEFFFFCFGFSLAVVNGFYTTPSFLCVCDGELA
jgi:hypothetical protein